MQNLTRRGSGMTPIPRRSRSGDLQVTPKTVRSVSHSSHSNHSPEQPQSSPSPVLSPVTGSTRKLRKGPPQRSATAHKQTPTTTRGPYRAQRSTLLLGRAMHRTCKQFQEQCAVLRPRQWPHVPSRIVHRWTHLCPSRVNSSHNKWQQMKEHKKSSGLTCKWVNTI